MLIWACLCAHRTSVGDVVMKPSKRTKIQQLCRDIRFRWVELSQVQQQLHTTDHRKKNKA